MMRKRVIPIVLAFCCSTHSWCQQLYYKMDVGTSNLYSFALSNLLTAGINSLTNTMLFDNAYTYTIYSSKQSEVSYQPNNVLGLTARDLLGDITFGAKLGLQNTSDESVSWGFYGSVHYRLNQFKTLIRNQETSFTFHDAHRILFGGGLMMLMGGVEKSTHLILEAGLRYECPLFYKNSLQEAVSEFMHGGFSSHYALRVNGFGDVQGVGVFVDVPHYHLFKKTENLYSLPDVKLFTIGINYTITPWRMKSLY